MRLKSLLPGAICLALGAMLSPAKAATSLVSPLQTYSCTANTWAATLTGGTAATTCTGFGAVAGGTVLGNPTAGSAVPTFNSNPVLGLAGTATGTLGLSGTTSGTVTIQPQGAAGTYNFNLPITAGSAGQVLTSQGGLGVAMTWANVATSSCTTVNNPTGPLNLTTAADGTCYNITNATAVTFNLTTSLTIGDNWCFFQASTGAITIAGVGSSQIYMGNNVGATGVAGTLVSQGAGSSTCLYISATTPVAIARSSEGYWINN